MVLIKSNSNTYNADLVRLLAFYRKNPVIAAEHLLVRDGEPVRLAPIQAKILTDWWDTKFSVTTASRGAGKFHDLNTKILTPKGWVRNGDLKVGDEVITPKGTKAKILQIHPHGKQDIYKLTFQDGRTALAGLPHLWKCIGIGGYGQHPTEWQIRSTAEIKEYLENHTNPVFISTVEETFLAPSFKDSSIAFIRSNLCLPSSPQKGASYLSNIRKPYLAKRVQQEAWKLGWICELKQVSNNIVVLLHIPQETSGLIVTSVEKHSHEEAQCISIDDPEQLYVIEDYIVTHNSYMSALYTCLQLLLYPHTRIGIFGPAFRQSKIIFGEMQKFYHASPLLQECCEKEPTIANDQAVFLMKRFAHGMDPNFAKALPVGSDGSRVRGERFSCFAYLSPILTNKGIQFLGDVVTNKQLQQNLKVLTPAGFVEPSFYIENPEEDLYEITLRGGLTLQATYDQKVLVQDEHEDKLLPISQLTLEHFLKLEVKDTYPDLKEYVPGKISPGLRLTKKTPYPKVPAALNEDLAELLGFIVSEGSCRNPSRVHIAQKDMELIDYFHHIFNKEFQCYYSVRHRSKLTNGRLCSWYEANFTNKAIRNILFNWGLTYEISDKKSIPESIFQSPRSVVCAFLRGLFEGDGGVFINEKVRWIHYRSASKELVQQIQHLLFCFGIYSSISTLASQKANHKTLYNLTIRQNSIIKFVDTIGFISAEKKAEAEKIKQIISEKNYPETSFYSQIASIKPVGKAKTYDVSLPTEDHLFVVNGVVVHNCIMLDESVQLPETIFRSVIRPMLSTTISPMAKVKLIEELREKYGDNFDPAAMDADNGYKIITSGYYQFNYWWDEIVKMYMKIKAGSRMHCLHFVPYTDLPAGFLNTAIVDDARVNDPSHVFLTEWCAEWIADSQGAFPMSLLEAARDISVTPKAGRNATDKSQFVFGIDVARERDSTAVVVVELGYPSKVIWIEEMQETAFPEQARNIINLIHRFDPVMINMDAGGGGNSLRDILADPESVGLSASMRILERDASVYLSGRRILNMCDFSPLFIEDINNKAKTLLENNSMKLPASSNPIDTKRVERGKNKEVDLVQVMINQIASVVITSTGTSGRLHYDVAKTSSNKGASKVSNAAKKKDLYTAFILAASGAYDLVYKHHEERKLLERGVIKEVKPPEPQDMYTMSRVAGGLNPGMGRIVIPNGGIITPRSRNGR